MLWSKLEQLKRLIAEEAQAPFDLSHGPLVRGRLIRLGEADHVLLLTQHHIVSDGWSLGVLLRELGELYRAFSQGQADPLEPAGHSVSGLCGLAEPVADGRAAAEAGGVLAGEARRSAGVAGVADGSARPVKRSYIGGRVPIVVDRRLSGALKELSLRQGTTLFMTLLGAWAGVLSRLSGQEDLIIGVPTANRGRLQTQGLIGFFVNTLALRIISRERTRALGSC